MGQRGGGGGGRETLAFPKQLPKAHAKPAMRRARGLPDAASGPRCDCPRSAGHRTPQATRGRSRGRRQVSDDGPSLTPGGSRDARRLFARRQGPRTQPRPQVSGKHKLFVSVHRLEHISEHGVLIAVTLEGTRAGKHSTNLLYSFPSEKHRVDFERETGSEEKAGPLGPRRHVSRLLRNEDRKATSDLGRAGSARPGSSGTRPGAVTPSANSLPRPHSPCSPGPAAGAACTGR